jgi:uncharacterized protein DUF4349
MTSPEALELEAVDAALAGRWVAPEHAELAELALLLRDDRPAPSPAWANRLDRRVEAGFPAVPRQRRRWVWLRNAAPVVAVFAAVAVIAVPIALIGISGTGSDDGDSSGASGGGGGVATNQAESAGDSAGSGASSGAADDAGGLIQRSAAPPEADRAARRKVERRVDMTLGAPRREIDRVATGVGDVAAELGGFVRHSRVTSSEGGDLQLRIPTRRLDVAVQRISKLAKVRELSRSADDITGVVVSARDRLGDARAERKSLLTQLASATTVNETESIRARLEIVSREIAAARNSLHRANNRANFADVGVTLVTTRGGSDDDEGGAWTPGDAWHDALRVLEVIAGIALIAAAIALPLLLLWLFGWLGRRGITRRRRERALDMA